MKPNHTFTKPTRPHRDDYPDEDSFERACESWQKRHGASRKRTRLTDEQEKQIRIAAFQKGKTAEEISREFGVSLHCIYSCTGGGWSGPSRIERMWS